MTIAKASCAFLNLADSAPALHSLHTKTLLCVRKRRWTTLDATRAGASPVGLLLQIAMLSALETNTSVGHRFHTVDAKAVASSATRTMLICVAHSFNVSAEIFLGALMNNSSWTHKQELKAKYLIVPRLLGILTAVQRAVLASLSSIGCRILWGEVIQDARQTASTPIA